MPDMTMDQLRERMQREHSKLYLVVMQPTDKYDVASDEGRETMRRHLNWQFSMEDRGILLGAGPFNTLGEAQTQQQFRAKAAEHSHMLNASGMYIIGAASREAAEAIAQAEPFEIKGWRTHTTVLWNLNEGVAWQVARKLVESVQGSVA